MTIEFAQNDRADVLLRATGTFTPGSPITLASHVTGRRGSTSARLRIRADQSPTGRLPAYLEETQVRSVSPNAQVDQRHVVTFAEPGYYHVMATASSDAESEVRADRQLGSSEVVTSNLWILIDDKAGRVDTEYDQSIVKDTTRYLTNGSVGAFRSRTVKPAIASGGDGAVSPGTRSQLAAASSNTAMVFSGRITYLRSDGSGTRPWRVWQVCA